MTTEPTTEIDPTAWHSVADATEALAVPGGAVLRVATYSTSGTQLLTSTFVPGVRLEPNGNEYGITARLVVVPAPTIAVHGDVFGTPTPEFVDALRRARPARPRDEPKPTQVPARGAELARMERDRRKLEASIDYAEIGKALRRERIRQGLSLSKLGARMNTESGNWISSVESAKRRRLCTVERIASALGLRLLVTRGRAKLVAIDPEAT